MEQVRAEEVADHPQHVGFRLRVAVHEDLVEIHGDAAAGDLAAVLLAHGEVDEALGHVHDDLREREGGEEEGERVVRGWGGGRRGRGKVDETFGHVHDDLDDGGTSATLMAVRGGMVG